MFVCVTVPVSVPISVLVSVYDLRFSISLSVRLVSVSVFTSMSACAAVSEYLILCQHEYCGMHQQ